MADWGNNSGWGAPAPPEMEWGPISDQPALNDADATTTGPGADNFNGGNGSEFGNVPSDGGDAGNPDDRGCFRCGKPG